MEDEKTRRRKKIKGKSGRGNEEQKQVRRKRKKGKHDSSGDEEQKQVRRKRKKEKCASSGDPHHLSNVEKEKCHSSEDHSTLVNGKSKKFRKNTHKGSLSEVRAAAETCENDVYQIPSVDEDSSKGMKKWISEYYRQRPGLKVLMQRVDDFITSYEEQQDKEIERRREAEGEEGWTVVTRDKGRKKTKDSESGVTVRSVSGAAVREKPPAPLSDFYNFHKKEAKRKEMMDLQSKFQEDRKRVQQLRGERKFRPY